jgi:hypothetical protein
MPLDDGDRVAESSELCGCGEAGEPRPDYECIEALSHEAECESSIGSAGRSYRDVRIANVHASLQRAVMLRSVTVVTGVGIIT